MENKVVQISLHIGVFVARMVLAAAFLFSGITKAVDPLGTAYKMQDYLIHFGWDAYCPLWMFPVLAMVLAGLEFYLGLCFLWGLRRKFSALTALLMLVVLTPLTLYLAMTNAIADCGCFGDAWTLTNWATFGKNVVLLTCALLLWWQRERSVRFIGENTQWLILTYGLAFVLLLMGHCLYHLPIADFRPYRIGCSIPAQMQIPPGEQPPQYETRFLMKKKDVQQEFTLENYPDSTWEFVDAHTVLVKEGFVPAIADFALERVSDGEYMTDSILESENYVFLMVAYDLTQAQQGTADQLNELYDYCLKHGYLFYGVTASGDEAIEEWNYNTGAEYEFCRMDAIPLKTMVRSNPGLVLLHQGVVVNKWGCNDFPDEEELTKPIEQTSLIQATPDEHHGLLWTVLLFGLILPLGLITLLDRVWIGLVLIGKLRKKSEITNLIKK